MSWINQLARQDIVALKAYESARSLVTSSKHFLDANENPFDDENGFNRYPKQQPTELVNKLANLYQVNPNHLLVTRGSDEGIDILIRTFCLAYQDAILCCPPTYGMYEISAQIQGVACHKVLLKQDDFSLDLEAILNAWQSKYKIIFLCSPNNPTGNLLNQNDIFALCEKLKEQALIVVDEAYIEFSSQQSLSTAIEQYSNLVVLRTLSKAYGLAGMRCGALIAHEDIIALVKKVLAPYPIPQATVQVVSAMLQPELIIQKKQQVMLIKNEREKLLEFLKNKKNKCHVFDSDTNFILIKTSAYKNIYQQALKNGIVLRVRDPEYLRISIGTTEQNQLLMEILTNAF